MTLQQCLDRLIALHEPGGESSRTSSYSPTGKIMITFTEGGGFFSKGLIKGKVIGLSLDSLSVFSGGCFMPECFEGGGLWTTALKTNKQSTINGVPHWFVPGNIDTEGALWYIDIGTTCPSTGEYALNDLFIPLDSQGSFSSKREYSSGIKVVILKRVTPDSVEEVAHKFGEFSKPDNLSRTLPKSALNYNALDQKTDLEELSLSIIGLVTSTYRQSKSNTKRYYTKGEPDPTLERIVEDNLSRLSRLIDTSSTNKRYGSIPRYIATYSEPEQLYGIEADSQYVNRTVKLFDEGCFEPGCFRVANNSLLVSREVDTKSIAWLVYALVIYSQSWQETKYDHLISILTQYLLNQIDSRLSLASSGWTHADVLTESVEIKTYSASTSIAVLLALLKVYSLRGEVKYLEVATNLHEGINKYLYSPRTQFLSQSLENSNSSLESDLYGLMLAVFLKRYDLVEIYSVKMQATLKLNYGQTTEEYIRDSRGALIQNLSGEYVYEEYDPLAPSSLKNKPLNLSIVERDSIPYNTLSSISNSNTLLISLLEAAAKKDIRVTPEITRIANRFESALESNENLYSLFTVSHCLSKRSYFSNPLISTFPIKDLEQIIFQRAHVFNKLQYFWAENYSWPDSKALTPLGQLGKLLLSLAKPLASIPTLIGKLRSSSQLQSARGGELDKLAAEFNYERLKQEADEELRKRVSLFVGGKDKIATEEGIKSKLEELEVKVQLEEPWRRVQIGNTFIKLNFSSVLGESYYSGENYATANLIEASILGIYTSRIEATLKGAIAAGIKLLLKERIELEDTFGTRLDSCAQLNQDVRSTCFILQEDGSRILTEDNNQLISCTAGEINPYDGMIFDGVIYRANLDINGNPIVD